MTRTAAIVGAGIGGLTAGLCLQARGWNVTIYERAPALEEVGAGIQISPNGTKILRELGLLSAEKSQPVGTTGRADPSGGGRCPAHLEDHAFEPPAIQMVLGQSKRRIFHMPMGQAARDRWGGPHLNIHRADLVAGLASAFKGDLHLGHPIDEAPQADLVIAADGLHSQFRAQIAGPDTPRFTGNIAWRALVPADKAPNTPIATTIWAGPGRHAITNRIRGGALINFVGIVETDEQGPEDWSAQAGNTAALADFAGWHPDLLTVIAAAETVNRWPLYDRAPIQKWTQGNVALLGDAAHPMLPSMAQGAVQAMEDAWVLAHCLDQAPVPQALETYTTLRQPRTAKIQALSAKNLRQFHANGAVAQMLTYAPMAAASAIAPKQLYSRPDWIYRANPEDWRTWT